MHFEWLDRTIKIFGNPFTLSVLACTGALLVGGLALPSCVYPLPRPPGLAPLLTLEPCDCSSSLPGLDKAVAILETVLTFAVSYPASIAFGRVLLQTAPPQRAVQMINLTKSLKEVEGHPLVVYLAVSRSLSKPALSP